MAKHLKPLKTLPDGLLADAKRYQLMRTLGSGGEGTVHLLRDRERDTRSVLKVFHQPISGTSGNGLRIYAAGIDTMDCGLFDITLIGTSDQIYAVQYPYLPLYRVHKRFFRHWPHTAKAAFGAYCQIQHYLMSDLGIGLADTVVDNFLLADDGQFYFVDFGFAIKKVDHPRYIAENRFGYGFFMMLLSLFGINIKLEMQVQTNCSLQDPVPYIAAPSIALISKQHAWVGEIVSQLKGETVSAFHEPHIYQSLAMRLPSRVPAARIVTLGSRLITVAKS